MIEVGEYIRSYDGYIGKVIEIRKDKRECDTYYKTDKSMANGYYEHIKAHSKNIIDLIEVGDYVNWYRVTGIMCGYVYLDKINAETRKVKTLADYQIETILTHELYEEESYKVVE